MYQATRLFASNLAEPMAQRFYNLVLLPRVRDDIDEFKRLNFHLYQALRKAMFKPAAFFKGIVLPLCEVCANSTGCFSSMNCQIGCLYDSTSMVQSYLNIVRICSPTERNVHPPRSHHRFVRFDEEFGACSPCVRGNAQTGRDGVLRRQLHLPASTDRQEVHSTVPRHRCTCLPLPAVSNDISYRTNVWEVRMTLLYEAYRTVPNRVTVTHSS